MGRNDGKTENLTDRLIHNLCRLTKGAGNSTTMCKNGGQHAGLFPTPPGGEEELLQWYQRVGVARIAGFLFPVLTPGFAGEKLLFPNIALLGKTGGFFADFSLLYPLLAGVVILAAIRRLKGMIRGAVILGSGLLPVALRLFTGTDLFAFAVRKLYRSTIWIQVAILSLVALYVGARTIQAHDNSQGRWISMGYDVLFMATIFLPEAASPSTRPKNSPSTINSPGSPRDESHTPPPFCPHSW